MASTTESQDYPSLAWVHKVYDDLRDLGDSFYIKERAMLDLKSELEKRISTGLLTGEIVGKNERERDAAALQLYGDDFERLSTVMVDAANTKHELQNAQIEEQRLKMIMRLCELRSALADGPDSLPHIYTMDGKVVQ